MKNNKLGDMNIVQSVLGALVLIALSMMLFFSYKMVKKPFVFKEESAVEANGPVLSIVPSLISKDLSQSFNVDLILDTKTEKASATEIVLVYNPTILRANSITPGSFLPVVLKTGAINNGTVTLALGVNPTEPKQGVGILATVNFTTLAYGNDTINYTAQTQLAVISQTTNFISSLTGSIITVAAPTPTPTLTPIPTFTPVPSNTPIPQPSATPLPTTPWSTPVPTNVPTVPVTPVPSSTPPSAPTIVPPISGSVVTVYAAGTKAGRYSYYPNMKLIIDGHTVLEALAVAGNPALRQFIKYTHNSSVKVTPKQVLVKFTNDYYRRVGRRSYEDRNLMVDKIEIDGVEYQTEADTVYTRYTRHSGCHSGYLKSEWLYCNGYLAY